MKNSKLRKIIGKVIGLALTLCALMGVMIFSAPTSVVQAAEGPASLMYNSSLNAGGYVWGTPPVEDQTKTENSSGYYYTPNSYVYFGEVYNGVTGSYEPVLFRVLDADADSNGAAGAMFLLSENAIKAEPFYIRPSYTAGVNFENVYTYSNVELDVLECEINEKLELNYLRRITKTDKRSEHEKLFGYTTGVTEYSWLTNTVNDESSYGDWVAVQSDEATYLDNSPFFLLSPKEINDYMASYNGAPSLKATNMQGDTAAWLTRLGMEETYAVYNKGSGTYVGAVDADGNVVPVRADDASVYTRLGLNIELDSIVYSKQVSSDTYKLAFEHSAYTGAESDKLFGAEVLSTTGNVVTIRYWNTYMKKLNARESVNITVFIEDDKGNIKYHGSIAELEGIDHYSEFIDGDARTAQFYLPSNYNEATDKIVVFWELKQNGSKGTSFVSNRVELDCAHTGGLATCIAKATCTKCGIEYGDKNPDAHISVDHTNFICDDEDGENIHWLVCSDCEEKVYVEACTFADGCHVYCDKCSTLKIDRTQCHYNENGICTSVAYHYEPPTVVYDKENNRRIVTIENEGQWIYFAEAFNTGEPVYDASGNAIFGAGFVHTVRITSDLDFSEVDKFVPMGSADNYMNGEVLSYGGDFTISGIRYESDGANVGLFGCAKNLTITNLTITDSRFKGASNVGALVGYGYNVRIEQTRVMDDVTVSAADGTEGAFIGTALKADENTSACEIVSASVAIDVKNAAGKDLAFASNDGDISVSSSFCLYESDGASGRTSAATFASGSVAYVLQRSDIYGSNYTWSQRIDDEDSDVVDALPQFVKKGNSYTVRKISYCNDDFAKYTNNATKDYTVHKPTEVLDWKWDVQECDALIKCGLCGVEEWTVATVTPYYGYSGVKADYIATVTDIYGEAVTDADGNVISDTITIIAIHIEDTIGMTYIEKVYDGAYLYPDDMMDNHRLISSPPGNKQYEVYFVNSKTGEKLVTIETESISGQWVDKTVALPAIEVGTYDLVVVGKREYEGQSYTYEGALVIKPVTVEVTPEDVYKYYDGNGSFEPKYTATSNSENGISDSEFKITYETAASAETGVYELKVTATVLTDSENMTVVLTRDTVQAVILPQLYTKVENKSYPTKLTYGDALPTPKAENFTFTEGSELTFEWYAAVLTNKTYTEINGEHIEYYDIASMSRLDGVPKNVGDYILRVRASGTGTLAASYCDVRVEILPRKIGYKITVPEGTPTVEYYGITYYLIDSPDDLTVELTGLAEGDTLESAGISYSIDWSYKLDAIATMPDRLNYYISCDVNTGENYSADGESVYVSLAPVGYASVVDSYLTYDGNSHDIEVEISWKQPDVSMEYGSYFNYTVTVKGDGYEKKYSVNGNYSSAEYNTCTLIIPKAGTYQITVHAKLEDQTGLNDAEFDSDISSYTLTVGIVNNDSEADDKSVSTVSEVGRHTVTVTATDGETEAVVKTADIYVRREVIMDIKECEVDLDKAVVFDKTKVVMQAGKVILLTHELAEITCVYNADRGEISIGSYKIIDKATGEDVSHLYYVHSTSTYKEHEAGGGVGIAHIFYASCDSTCNVYGCEYTRAATHSGGEATCVELAICEHCHSPYGSFDTDNHVSDATHIAPNGEDLGTHLLIHTCCGRTAKVLPHTAKVVATCTTRALCADCGWEYGEVDPHNHSSNECTYEYVGEDGHKLIHKCCSAVETVAHTGGKATCTALATCEHCAHTYGRLDPDNHSGEIKYTADKDDPSVHLEEYPCCGTSAIVKHSGGEATCVSLAVCELCKAEYGALDPHNHATDAKVYTVRADNGSMHDIHRECCGEYLGKEYHSGGEGTCVSAAVCQHCGTEYGSSVNSENHASSEFVYKVDPSDTGIHIKAHACCGVEVERGGHSGGEASCEHGALCELCGYDYTERVDHIYADDCTAVCSVCGEQTRGLSFHIDADNDDACDKCGTELEREPLSGGAVSGIVTGSAVAVGTGSFSLVWFVFKKKKWADLLRLLLGI